MKKLSIFAGLLLILGLTASCEKDLVPYDTPDAWLNFAYYDYNNELVTDAYAFEETMAETHYSFVIRSSAIGEDLQRDTVWFEVTTMGFLSAQNRPVEFQQIATGENDAVPGVHYVAFDDPSLLAKSYVPGNQNQALVPIVVLRDGSLDQNDVVLQFTFKENGYFKPGYDEFIVHTLYISNHLAQPSKWSSYYCDYYFGTYGQMKHQLMMEWTGNAWDDAYLDELFSGDNEYLNYLGRWFSEKLDEENQKRQEQGEDIYREDDGTPVSFDPVM